MWKEFLDSDTYAKGRGSTVAKVLAGQVQPSRITGMVSVINPGLDTNWCGHHFSQSNWYAFGRLRGIRNCPPKQSPMNGRA